MPTVPPWLRSRRHSSRPRRPTGRAGRVPSFLGTSAFELWSRAAPDLAPTADHTEIARWLEAEAAARG